MVLQKQGIASLSALSVGLLSGWGHVGQHVSVDVKNPMMIFSKKKAIVHKHHNQISSFMALFLTSNGKQPSVILVMILVHQY